MKKLITCLLLVLVLFVVIKEFALRSPEGTEKWEQAEEWVEPWKDKIESAAEDIGGQISDMSGELTGQWNDKLFGEKENTDTPFDIEIDTAEWFDPDREILSGQLKYTKISEGTITKLIVWTGGCQVEWMETEEADFYLSFENMKKIQVYQDEEVLVIKSLRDTTLNTGEKECVMKLYVPKGIYLSEAELELGAGSLEADMIWAKTLNIKVEAGKLEIDSLQAESIDTQLGAGMVELEHINVQDGSFSVGAGSMMVEGNILEKAQVKCAAGNIQMQLDGKIQDYNYEIVCMAGNIQIGEEKYFGISEEKTIDNSAQKDISLNCAVGNVKLTFD